MHKPDNQFANIQPPHRQEETQAAQVAARRICLLGDNALLARDTALQLQCLGYEVAIATQLEQLAALLAKQDVSCIVVDHSGRGSRFADPAGVAQIRSRCETPVPILWFASRNNFEARLAVASAGVDGYLAKPADADDVTDALLAPHNEKAPPPENPMSADRVRWEHIQRVYELCNRNVSETARRLNMHRRTLQRILAKRAPK